MGPVERDDIPFILINNIQSFSYHISPLLVETSQPLSLLVQLAHHQAPAPDIGPPVAPPALLAPVSLALLPRPAPGRGAEGGTTLAICQRQSARPGLQGPRHCLLDSHRPTDRHHPPSPPALLLASALLSPRPSAGPPAPPPPTRLHRPPLTSLHRLPGDTSSFHLHGTHIPILRPTAGIHSFIDHSTSNGPGNFPSSLKFIPCVLYIAGILVDF
jgi:hypothetical protein